MEKLSEKQKEALGKMATAKVVIKLANLGVNEEDLSAMDRPQLLATYAELLATGRDKPSASVATAAAAVPTWYDPELEKLRLQFEREKHADELALKQKTHDEELALKRDELEVRKAELAVHREADETANSIRQRQLTRDNERDRLEGERRESIVSRTKLYSDAIGKSLPSMPADPIDLTAFFQNVETMFVNYDVPRDVKVALLRSCLSDKARLLLSRIDSVYSNDYNAVKKYILDQYHLSPQMYRSRFVNAEKQPDETYTLFCNRVKTLFDYYVNSRKVTTLAQLISLMVADRVKGTLSEGCLRHVLAIESNDAKGWLECEKLADAIDKSFRGWSTERRSGRWCIETHSTQQCFSNQIFTTP